ncbi:hypothetical protein BARBAKC583_1280 [Bartonella bacilliformis KC583]|uniref:Uncharacterized protein n=1 Tax=Bartonella bacilliformis (strain ATCC 35685 / KC583 / Herrer 020/F12,63) TaxID=360095 RepID=A1UU76_BARBK|nr:hypothetical protein BARBAKC583_1280 [Bartonella bacilliformis KC583]
MTSCILPLLFCMVLVEIENAQDLCQLSIMVLSRKFFNPGLCKSLI